MTAIPFVWAEAVLTGIRMAVRIVCAVLRGHISLKREAALLMMYVNLAVLLRFTFFPPADIYSRCCLMRRNACGRNGDFFLH